MEEGGHNPARRLLSPPIFSQEGDDDEDDNDDDDGDEDDGDVDEEDSDCEDRYDDDENPWLWTYLTVHWKRGDITQQAAR